MPAKTSSNLTLRDQLWRLTCAECIEPGEDGRPRLTITLPNAKSFDKLAATLARFLSIPRGREKKAL